jgi:hypothetical protein
MWGFTFDYFILFSFFLYLRQKHSSVMLSETSDVIDLFGTNPYWAGCSGSEKSHIFFGPN